MRYTYIYLFFIVLFLIRCKENNSQPIVNQPNIKQLDKNIKGLSEYVYKYILNNPRDSLTYFKIIEKRKITNLGAVYYRIRENGTFDGDTHGIIFDSINNKFYNLNLERAWDFRSIYVAHFNLMKTISILEDDKLMPVCNSFKDLEAFLNESITTRYSYLMVDAIDSLIKNERRLRIRTISELEDNFPKYNNVIYKKLKKMNQWDHFKKVIQSKFNNGNLLLYLYTLKGGGFICIEVLNYCDLNHNINIHFPDNYNIKVVEYIYEVE